MAIKIITLMVIVVMMGELFRLYYIQRSRVGRIGLVVTKIVMSGVDHDHEWTMFSSPLSLFLAVFVCEMCP